MQNFQLDDICAVVKQKYRIALAPHHLHEIARATFNRTRSLDCIDLLVWALNLNEDEKTAHRIDIMDSRIQAHKPRYINSPMVLKSLC